MMYGITFKIIQVQEKKVWTCRSIAETRLSELLKLGWRLEIQYTLLSRPLCTSEIVYNNKTRNQNQRLPKANAINIKQTNKTKPKHPITLRIPTGFTYFKPDLPLTISAALLWSNHTPSCSYDTSSVFWRRAPGHCSGCP
jgi:hypothetical protein